MKHVGPLILPSVCLALLASLGWWSFHSAQWVLFPTFGGQVNELVVREGRIAVAIGDESLGSDQAFVVRRISGSPEGIIVGQGCFGPIVNGCGFGENGLSTLLEDDFVIARADAPVSGEWSWLRINWTTDHTATDRLRGVMLAMPVWYLLAPVGLWLLWRLRSAIRAARAFEAGCCQRCGYDLRATPDRCPECGHVAVDTEDSSIPGAVVV